MPDRIADLVNILDPTAVRQTGPVTEIIEMFCRKGIHQRHRYRIEFEGKDYLASDIEKLKQLVG